MLEGFSYVGCLSLSGFDEISMVVFEAGASLIIKAEEERKRLQNIFIFVELTAGSQNEREGEREREREYVCLEVAT